VSIRINNLFLAALFIGVILFPTLSLSEEIMHINEANAPAIEKTLTLEECFQLAVENNEDILIKDLDVYGSKLLPWTAVAQEIAPTIKAEGSVEYPKEEIFSGSSAIRADPQKEASITFTQPLIKPEFYPAFKRNKSTVRSIRESHNVQVQNTLFEVANSYFDFLNNQKLLEVAKETFKLAQEQLRISRERYDAGEVPKTDFLRAEVEVHRAKRGLTDAQNNWQLSRATLASLIGIKDKDFHGIPSVEENELFLEAGMTLEELINESYEVRPDLNLLTNEHKAAVWELRRVKMSYLPTLEAEFEQSWIEPEGFSTRNDFWTATLKVDVPIFEGGQRAMDHRQSRIRKEQTELRYERLKKDIRVQVTDAWLKRESAKVNLASFEKEVEFAAENYDVMTKRYEAGQATSLDTIDAFTNLVSAKVGLVNQAFDYQLATLNLYKQVGLLGEPFMIKEKVRE
jgi:outer membrane protein